MLEVTKKIKGACRQLYIYTVSINCGKIAYSVEINRLLWPVAEGTLDRHISQAQAKESQQQIPLNVVKLWASAFGGEIKSISAKYSGSQFLQKKYKEHEKTVSVQEIDGLQLVKKLAKDMERMFRNKAEAVRAASKEQKPIRACPAALVTLDNLGQIARPRDDDDTFECLPYQLSMVLSVPTMVTTGNGELGFDSGEGA
ncbi:hypothetical protein chiPu_0000256 [Chiloscyllium punctatum]|uniref:Uncharacterized protein n=1 Tax=Chiloscyllium punctatum TaxID=137246 RepID=A0A401RUP9_CHIPU|nr:hypothetical protein [Chiloscyllium punctatum]